MSAVGVCLGVWVWTLAVCFGLGAGLRRCVARERLTLRDVPLCAWLGYALLLVGLQAWHLAAPIQGAAFSFFSALGLAGCVAGLRGGVADCSFGGAKRGAIFGGLVLALGVFLALRARGPDAHYDTGLYFLQSVRWAHAYPLAPGLGNLDPRLAFNSSHFLYAAWVEACPWAVRAEQTANGAWVWLLLLHLGLNAKLLSQRVLLSRVFATLLLPVVWYLLAFGVGLNSLSPDLPIFALQIVLAELLLRGHEDARERNVFLCVSVVLIAVAALTVKLSCGVYSLVCVVVVALWIWRMPERRGAALAGVGVAAAAVGLWMFRGVQLSGYPLFPSTLAGWNVEWALPADEVRRFNELIRAYGRQPGAAWAALQDGAWFRPWMGRVWQEHKVLIVLPLAGTFLSLAIARLSRGERAGTEARNPPALFLLPAALGAGFWLGMAPEPRFAGAVFLILCAGSFVYAAEPLLPFVPRRIWHGWVLLAVAVFTVQVVRKGQPLIFEAGVDAGFHPHPSARVKVVKTESGLELHVPESGDQTWDAPLPATPSPKLRLRLREKGNPGAGFSVGD